MSTPALKSCPFCGGVPRIGTPRIGASSVMCETPSCVMRSHHWIQWHVWQYRPAEDALRAERDAALARAEAAEALITTLAAEQHGATR